MDFYFRRYEDLRTKKGVRKAVPKVVREFCGTPRIDDAADRYGNVTAYCSADRNDCSSLDNGRKLDVPLRR